MLLIGPVVGPALAKPCENILKRPVVRNCQLRGWVVGPPEPVGAPSTTALEPLLSMLFNPPGVTAPSSRPSSVWPLQLLFLGVFMHLTHCRQSQIDLSAYKNPRSLIPIWQDWPATLHGMRTMPTHRESSGFIPLAGPPLKQHRVY